MTAPTGVLAERVVGELADLARALGRLEAHAAAGTSDGLTAPDEPSGEQWDAGQVWAHLAEFGSFWLPELRRIVDARSSEPVPFGRTKRDAERIGAIERNCHLAIDQQMSIVRGDIAHFAHELALLDAADWERTGRHPTLGDMDLFAFLRHFVTGHYHEHADQLDGLRGER